MDAKCTRIFSWQPTTAPYPAILVSQQKLLAPENYTVLNQNMLASRQFTL